MSYIDDFIEILNQDDDNTYKTTWARAILECIEDEKYEIQNDYFVIYHYLVYIRHKFHKKAIIHQRKLYFIAQ